MLGPFRWQRLDRMGESGASRLNRDTRNPVMMQLLETLRNVPPNRNAANLVALVSITGVVMMLAKCRHLRGTTLLAPCFWSALSLVAIAACELALGWSGEPDSIWIEPLRFGSAVTTYCPIMATLGARRPQHQAWQMIVLSLWIILAMPAAECIMYQRGGALNVRGIRAVLLMVLGVVGLLNALPTRFWMSALLMTAGQVCLVSGYLPFLHYSLGTTGVIVGVGLLVAAVGLVVAGIPSRPPVLRPEDRVWLDFRDMFGVVWGMRVAERINASSSAYGWNIFLGWRGFRALGNQDAELNISDEVERALHKSLRSLLRRFVSPEWISMRLD